MAVNHRPETLTEKLRRSRRTLERQIEEGKASCDTQEVLDRLAKLRKGTDELDDSLVQRGDA